MKFKPLIILMGEPYSVFLEIFLKSYENCIKIRKNKYPIVLIGSQKLLVKQIQHFNYKYKIKIINPAEINKIKNNNYINLINVNFDKTNGIYKNINSNVYIEKTFNIAFKLLNDKKVSGLINGPISKKKFLNKKFLGITEYILYKTKSNNAVMLIYNKILSVSPLTTHLPIKYVARKITKKQILKKVILLNKFYLKKLKIKPKIAVLGLNPHCETTDKYSEENKIIIPAINLLIQKKINIKGPFSADTFFLKENYKRFNLVIGMYHDQVLTPIKTIFKFDAVNVTVGLPFIRLSPDHGPNEKMFLKGKSNPLSFKRTIEFFNNFKWDFRLKKA